MEMAGDGGQGLHQGLQRAQAAPVGVPTADGVERVGADDEGLHQDLLQAPVAPVVVESSGGRGSGEILRDDDEESRQAPAARPAASVPAEGEQGRGTLDVESGSSGLRRSANLHTVSRESNWLALLCVVSHPKWAKWLHAIIFLGGIALAIASRDTEVSSFSETERVHGCEHDRYCLSAESALRVSMAFFLFFTVMFATTVWTKKVHERRNFWNSNLSVALLIKIVLVAGCMYLAQVPPSPFIEFYGGVARIGAWLFLAIQLISVTRFIMWLNKWHQLNPERLRWLVHAAAILSNFGSLAVILWLMHEHTSNIVDFAIVTATLVLVVIMICFRSKYEVTKGWLAPGIMIAYIVYMCWTVLNSEPPSELTKAKHPKGADWVTIASFVFGVIVMAYSTLSTGEDYEWLQFNEEVPSEDDIPYGFGYFHFVFALGSMYFGMLLVGWNANQTMQRWTIDFGWWSAVVRAVNGILAAVMYIWMLRTSFIWNKNKLVISWSGTSSLVPHVTFL